MAKKLKDFFGILSDREAGEMRINLKKIKARQLKMLKEKLEHQELSPQ